MPKPVYRDILIEWFESNSPIAPFRKHGPCTIHVNGHIYFSQLSRSSDNRKAGPSAIYASGLITYTNPKGMYHRTAGPAIINADGTKEYRINGKEISSTEFFLKYGAS